ncbi:Catsper1, partial [Symbiodinium pilosum]
DGDGELNSSDLQKALDNEEFVEILRLLEVPVMNAENLMRLFDRVGRGHVSFGELVEGITSMLEDINPKDYTKLALWSDSLMKRMEMLEQRCNFLANMVIDLRRQIEECFNCLALFIDSRENTELYYRALKAIRSAPPPVPVDIREALGLEVKKEKLSENEAEALMNFARRYIAPKQHAKKKDIQDDSPGGSPRSPSPKSSWHSGLRVA